MKITLTNAGKRFNREWIFRHLNYEFFGGRSYAIIGPNGSGKSTLLQFIAGALAASEGSIEYLLQDESPAQIRSHPPVPTDHSQAGIPASPSASSRVSLDNIFRHISFSAPYLELIEEMTLREFLAFHQLFKPFLSGLSVARIMDLVHLPHAADKQIRYFSSGMKQRVKLAQALFSDTPLVLLDEPCTNLDVDGIELYQQLLRTYCPDRLVIVSSNDIQEYGFCEERLEMKNYK